MKQFFHSGRFKALVVVALLLCGFMIYALSQGGGASGFIGAITTPLQSLSSAISKGADSFFSQFVSTSDLQKQLDQKEEELRELREKQVDYDSAIRENEELRRYLDIKEKNDDFELEPAQVVARDNTDLYYNFTVNTGSASGVELRDPVITADGLVGYVSEVYPTYSIVRSILDPSTEIGAQDSHTQENGVVGLNTIDLAKEGMCRLNYLDRGSSVSRGNLVVTSGVGGAYPRGLIIGTVEEVLQESDGISIYATIRPAADILHLTDVMIIKSFYGQGVGIPGQDDGTSTGEPSGPESTDNDENSSMPESSSASTSSQAPSSKGGVSSRESSSRSANPSSQSSQDRGSSSRASSSSRSSGMASSQRGASR
nr:rod shape-determining protein MreC [uncultured Solibaculum sp.]